MPFLQVDWLLWFRPVPEASHPAESAIARGPALWWQMFRVYFVLGATGFGGNYQARLHREAVRHGWQSEDDLAKLLTLATLVPGGNTTNYSVQIGYRTAGLMGLLCAVVGTFLPGLTGVIALASLYDAVADNEQVGAALRGVEAAVVGLVAWVSLKMGTTRFKDRKPAWLLAVDLAIAGAVFAALLLHLSFLIAVPSGIALGLIVRLAVQRHGRTADPR